MMTAGLTMAAEDRTARRGVFRLAVTGHRPNRMPAAEWPRLMRQLDGVLAEFEARHPGRAFALLSGLAEGADRLAAKAALKRGWRLEAALPFSRRRYREDFPDKRAQAEFARLMRRAARVTLSPAADRYADAADAYAELGDVLIAQADALIALWDGEGAQGRGGTVDVMAAARDKGIPVVWLHAREDRPPQWLT